VRSRALEHRFVSAVPHELEPDVVYVSMEFATALHICPSCGRKVVTPFAPGSWNFRFDGETISIHPSIRNGAHGCGAHYWIRNDRLLPAFDRDERGGQVGPAPQAGAGARREHDEFSVRSWIGRTLDRIRAGFLR